MKLIARKTTEPSPGHCLLLTPLLPLLLLLCQQFGLAESILWTRAFQTELGSRTFGGIHLCSALQLNNSVNITALDAYNSPAMGRPGVSYAVKSQTTMYVVGCAVSPAKPSADGTYVFLKPYLVPAIQWGDICDNTRNLIIYMSVTGASSAESSNTVQPCNYRVQHAGLTSQQVTAWIALTYSADWSPVWTNRTDQYPESATAATVVLRSDTDPAQNATWRNVLATGGLPAESAMTPAQRALAILASMSLSGDKRWWLLICGAINAPGNMLVSLSDATGSNETLEYYMNCSARTTLVWGASPSSAVGAAEISVPAISSSSGGYWGRALGRLLDSQTFGGAQFCNATTGVGFSIGVTGIDDIGVTPGAPAIARGTYDLQVMPCSTSISLALGDAYLKTFLRSEANWTEVCADSMNPAIAVNLGDRTAVQFSPCPQPDASADPSAVASKAAWCILALNTSSLELEWISRETTSPVEPSAVSVSFSVLGETNGTVLQWGNVLVNGLTIGDQVDRLV